MYGYIYKTTNLVNGKIYIGKKKGDFTNNYLGSGKYLKNAIHKYGKDNFVVEKLEDCESLDIQNYKEKYWIQFYMQLNFDMYNISKGGDGGDTYYKLNDFDRNIRINKLCRNSYFSNLSKEEQTAMRKKAWETRRRNGNDKFSEEYRRKLSESHKGQKPSLEQIQKRVITRKLNGYKHSEETKLKISNSNKGKHKATQQQINRMSALGKSQQGSKNPFYGKTHTKEIKQLIGSFNKERFKNKIWINNDVINKRVDIDKIEDYLLQGFKKGRIKWREKH